MILKKTHIILFCIAISIAGTAIFSCRKKEQPFVYNPTKINFTIPAGFPATQYDFTQNPLTEEGFALGKKIFYDNRLSSDGTVSCGSCHQQFAGFVQYDHDFAHGIGSVHTTRNPQPLINLAWHSNFMWDGGVNHLEVQPLAPFTSPIEMNMTIEQVLQKINENAEYKILYRNAFGDETINSQRTLKALAQFTVMLVSSNSKYDKVKRNETTFSPLENLGYQTFLSKCNTCHVEPLFTDLSFRNIGLPINSFLQDKGRMTITGSRQDSLKFKVPTLRNAALTFPYTHDGRYYSLERMIDHYRNDVVLDFSTDAQVRNKISITNTERSALVAFINTLTDTTFTKNPKFAER